MAYQIPASDPHAIFVAAEDFRLAYEALTLLPDSGADTLRTLVPQSVCAAFAIELYLKCILVDAGAKTVPPSHNLLLLYQQIPKTAKAAITRQWRSVLKAWKAHDATVNLESDLASILGEIAEAFEQCRYRFESPQTMLPDGRFTLVHASLHGYILEKHPDWRDEGHSYFPPTFRAL